MAARFDPSAATRPAIRLVPDGGDFALCGPGLASRGRRRLFEQQGDECSQREDTGRQEIRRSQSSKAIFESSAYVRAYHLADTNACSDETEGRPGKPGAKTITTGSAHQGWNTERTYSEDRRPNREGGRVVPNGEHHGNGGLDNENGTQSRSPANGVGDAAPQHTGRNPGYPNNQKKVAGSLGTVAQIDCKAFLKEREKKKESEAV